MKRTTRKKQDKRAPLVFPSVTKIDIASVLAMHPTGEDGVVLFTNDPENYHPYIALPTNDIASTLPVHASTFDSDSFFTFSRFREPKRGLSSGYATKRNVSHLTTAWVDIDGRNAPGGALEGWQVLAEVWRSVENGLVPYPSVVVDSGRGIWLLWHITPVEIATPATIKAITRINQYAATFFQALGADFGSTNVNRWTRIPGSLNSNSQRRCTHLAMSDERGDPIAYTLAELTQAFAITRNEPVIATTASAPQKDQVKRTKNPVKQTAGQKGRLARSQNIIDALFELAVIRGGFRKGTRGMACHYLAVHLRDIRVATPVVISMLSAPRLFKPPLPISRIQKHVKSSFSFKRTTQQPDGTYRPLSQRRIADVLGITPSEITKIEANIGIRFRHSSDHKADIATTTKRERIDARRGRVAAIIADEPGISERSIVARLTAENVPTSTFTVHGDLVALRMRHSEQLGSEHQHQPE